MSNMLEKTVTNVINLMTILIAKQEEFVLLQELDSSCFNTYTSLFNYCSWLYQELNDCLTKLDSLTATIADKETLKEICDIHEKAVLTLENTIEFLELVQNTVSMMSNVNQNKMILQ